MNLIHHAQSFLHTRVVTLLTGSILILALWPLPASPASVLDGQVRIHDPSTIMLCDGKYYTYGTGGTPLVSDDG